MGAAIIMTPVRHVRTLLALCEGREFEVAEKLGMTTPTVRKYLESGSASILAEKAAERWCDALRRLGDLPPDLPPEPEPRRTFAFVAIGQEAIHAVVALVSGLGDAVEHVREEPKRLRPPEPDFGRRGPAVTDDNPLVLE